MKKYTENHCSRYSNEYSPGTPNWKTTKEAISYKYTTLTKKLKENFYSKKFNSNEKFLLRPKPIKSSKNSPIINAYNHLEEFYQNIRPFKSRPDSSSESIFTTKPQALVSYFSEKSSENYIDGKNSLKDLIELEKLSLLTQALTPDSVINESNE